MFHIYFVEKKVRKRNARTTKQQIDVIVNFLEDNKILIQGKVEPKDLQKVEALWVELTSLLNGTGKGPKRSVDEWKTVVKEFKNNVKKRCREVHVDKISTGGGPRKVKELSEVEERMMGLISKVSIEGAPIQEAGICIVNNESVHLNTNSDNAEDSIQQLLVADEEMEIIFEGITTRQEKEMRTHENKPPPKASTPKRRQPYRKFSRPSTNISDLATNVKEQTQALKELAIAMTALSTSVSAMAVSLNNIANRLNK